MKALTGRIALVTGSTTGIGNTVARRLAKEGATLVMHGIASEDEAARACAEIAGEFDTEVVFEAADLRQPAQIETLIANIDKRYGRLDILVNNAGMQHVSPIETFPVDAWNDMLAVNLSASFHTMRLAIPVMRRANWGRIINMASISGLRGRAGKPAYNATKHGLIGLTKSVALELAPTGITCNAICPGWVHTPLVQRQVDALAAREGVDNDEATRRLISLRQPTGRFVTKEQIAGMVMFLCSPDADEVQGAAWTIDGGTTAA